MINLLHTLSMNNVVLLLSATGTTARSLTVQFGLYSMNANTLTLLNSASKSSAVAGATSVWISMVTSATTAINPGVYYLGINALSGAAAGMLFYANSSIAAAGAAPGGFLRGRVTASTNAMPVSIATTDLDNIGSDAERQFYIILTA